MKIYKSKKWFLSVTCVLFMIFFSSKAFSGPKLDDEESTNMRVKFYALNEEKNGKGEFLGTVEIKEDKLSVQVTHSGLKNLLTQPISIMKGGTKERVEYLGEASFSPGTIEHLKAAIAKVWEKYRIISEVVEK
ncbi:MAG: hypothetical protein P9M06_02955 [Candidatus Saelkia tenebricola]|nr:hypothetical protein [Candidatus Saelkia tenebricola]